MTPGLQLALHVLGPEADDRSAGASPRGAVVVPVVVLAADAAVTGDELVGRDLTSPGRGP
jgi:hypothetical protein